MFVKSKTSSDCYEVGSVEDTVIGRVYSGYRLSKYDGMPIGPRITVLASEVDEVKYRPSGQFDVLKRRGA